MDRIIKLAEVEAAVAAAFDAVKSENEGTVDPRAAGQGLEGKFGISVGFTDGSLINKGDTDTLFCMGQLASIPVAATLLTQKAPEEIVKKAGNAACGCACAKPELHALPLPARALRAVSAIEPTGDPEGKMTVVLDMLRALAGSDPVLNDKAYEAQRKLNADAKVEDVLAQTGFYLYDDAPIAIDIFSKLETLQINTAQLATIGATIAADGRNAATGVPAFDGALTQNLVGVIAAHGMGRMNRPWLLITGTPAKRGWGGGVVAVLPGVMAIAAFSPELNEAGVPVKAAKSVVAILKALGISALASAKVKVEK